MNPPTVRSVAFAVLLLAASVGPGWSDAPVAANILNPNSAPEAWNVIGQATRNVQTLLDENRLSEVPVQISFCSPALRLLARSAPGADGIAQVGAKVDRAMMSVLAIARGGQDNNPGGVQSALDSLSNTLEEIAQHFEPQVVGADIFVCPMHSDFISQDKKTACAKCGMELLKRRIPASFIYMKPGEPTVRLTASASAPIEAGKQVEVKVRMEKADKSPVRPADLLVMHTAPIHLLIDDPSLSDYHHELPVATATPGEYVFSFTPKKTGPYRIWADIVPTATGLQELPFVDLPGTGEGTAVTPAANTFSATAGGLVFKLSFPSLVGSTPRAGKIANMSIEVSEADGTPVRRLEPVMNSFAHVMGFYDDYRTVVHLHPTGGDILRQDLRGGPSMGFKFYPPQAGFVRLYCQVQVDGKSIFAPFNVNVAP